MNFISGASWRHIYAIVASRRLFVIFLMGGASGLPLLLTSSTLYWRLASEGVDKTTIGFYSLVGLPYTLKFLWSFVCDGVRFDRFVLGHRRSWIMLTQCCLIVSLLFLGRVDPVAQPYVVAFAALLVAFWSASQDIVIDAYRIELLAEEEQAAGSAATQLGYRLGLLVSGAGALFLSDHMPWHHVYDVMALCMVVGMASVLLAPKPISSSGSFSGTGQSSWQGVITRPFMQFMDKPHWLLLLMFIVLYKLTDATLGVMANPFYYELGFQASQIALISKIYGVLATLAGIVSGGFICLRWGLYSGLMVCGILQMLSNLVFIWQAEVGSHVGWLYVTITIENMTGGMGSAAFVAFLSALCHPLWAATQYALLSSFMAFGRSILSSFSGVFADMLGWHMFFVFSAVVALPSLWMMWALRSTFRRWLSSE